MRYLPPFQKFLRRKQPQEAAIEAVPLRWLQKVPQSPSLQTVLIASFVCQILMAVGVVGYLSFRNGQKAVNDLVLRLHTQVSEQINHHLNSFFEQSLGIVKVNSQAIRTGLLDPKDPQRMEQFFGSQLKEYRMGYISFTNPQGEFIGVERLRNNELIIHEVNAQTPDNSLYQYQADGLGQPKKLKSISSWDPRSESWYRDTIASSKPIWRAITPWKNQPDMMAVATNAPVYDLNRQLLGMISVDVRLSQLRDCLNQMGVGYSSTVFILDRQGFLVLASSAVPVYQVAQQQVHRIKAQDSEDSLIRETVRALSQTLPTWQQIQQHQPLEFQWNGQRQFVQISPWQDPFGLDWLLVVTTPESEFMAQIQANRQMTVLLCGIALMGAITSSVLTARWLTRPILKLSDASQAIAAGDLSQPLQWSSSSYEVNALSASFESMRQTLQQALQQLETYARSLEDQVEERTSALAQTNEQLQQTLHDLHATQDHLVQSAKMAVLGQLVASVAHDMNTPLGAIRSSAANLSSGLLEAVQELPALLALLPADQQQHFSTLLQQALTQVPKQRSAREKRQQRRCLEQQLEQQFSQQFSQQLASQMSSQTIANPKVLADLLVELDLNPTEPALASLLHTPHSHRALETLYHFASTQRSLRTIQQAVEAASQVVLALRTYAHQDHDRTQVPVNVVDSIETALTLHQNLIRRGVIVDRDYAENLPKVMASPDDLRQVWMNLVHNALQAMNYQGTLKIQTRQRRNKIEVNITDNGEGIDPEILLQIFDPFFTTRNPGEGSGLGLSIAKKLLEKYQGSIAVESSPEETTFTVRLLIYTPEIADDLVP